MATRKPKILDFYASKHWAILPETLEEMYRLYTEAIERKESGINLDVEAVAAKLGRPLDNSHSVTVRDGIAVIPISGPIFRYANLFTEISGATSIDTLARDFRQALDDPAIKAIVLEINSPGGEADGTSELAQHIAEARGQKPITAYISNLGASAAYWLASAADQIVVNKAASVGSIGVVCSVSVQKDKNRLELVSSQSPNKRPNVETEGGRSQVQQWLDALAGVFIGSVAENRNMTSEQVIEQGGKGGLKVGQQAVDAGLADRLGTLESVIAELSDPQGALFKPRSQNLNNSAVLQTGADSNPLEGVEMADKKPTEEIEKKPAAEIERPPKSEPVDTSAELEAATAENARLKAQLAEEQTAREKLTSDHAATATKVAELEKQARTSRFETISKGWPGEAKSNLSMLEHLATSAGEDSELFKGYVTTQDAAKAQIESGLLLKELGSSAVEGSAAAEIDNKAKKMAAESGGKTTYQQAYDQLYAADSDLRSRVNAEERQQAN